MLSFYSIANNFLHATLQIIEAADEVINSIDRDELAKFLALKNDPEDEEAEVLSFLLLLFTNFFQNLFSKLTADSWHVFFLIFA